MSLISGANPSPRSCSSPSPILSGTRRLSPANSIRFSPPMQLHEHDNPRRLHFLQGLLSSYPIWLRASCTYKVRMNMATKISLISGAIFKFNSQSIPCFLE
ncbi:hypothetical protein Peur_024583 [Populus x canadensis]